MSAAPIAFDAETFFSKKLKYGLTTMGPEQYCAHEMFDCYLISVCDGTTTWAGHPSKFNWAALDGQTLLSHNTRFDRTVYEELVRRKLAPAMKFAAWHCTASMTAFLCNRRSLKEAAEHLLGGTVSKEYRLVADGKNWPRDFSAAEQEQVIAAGRQDAQTCWTLFDKFGHKWPEIERRLSALTVDQGMRGVQIDVPKLNDYLIWTHEMLQATEKTIPWISGAEDDDSWDAFNTKPTSTKCIAENCRRVGIPCPPVKSDDAEAFELWEATHSPGNPWIKSVTAWRSLNKLYRTFVTVKERLRADGTLPFSTKYCGAATGRWSGDSRINMQNMRKRPVVCNEWGLLEPDDKRADLAFDEAEVTGNLPSWVRHTIDFRSLIIPRPGKRMIVSDLSQIEPRILAWLIGDTEFLRRVAAGESPYQVHARMTMGFTGEKMDSNSDDYRLAKARVLGLGYQCGSEKFCSMAWTLARLDITKNDPEWIEETDPFTGEVKRVSGIGSTAKQIVKDFRAQNPKIVGLWQMLGDKFKSSIGGDFSIKLPSGRVLHYDKVRASVKIEKDKETGKPVRKTVFTANTNGRWTGFYGGRLTENLVQATARDVFAEHLIQMEDRGWKNLFGCHDEAILEVDQDVTAADVQEAMSYCPPWLAGCPVAAKAQVVDHYLK